MGECSDFYVGETVHVTVPFDSPHSLVLEGRVCWVWDPFIDVTVASVVVRFPREVFDCTDLELGRPVSVEIGNFEQHFGLDEYHPEDEQDFDA